MHTSKDLKVILNKILVGPDNARDMIYELMLIYGMGNKFYYETVAESEISIAQKDRLLVMMLITVISVVALAIYLAMASLIPILLAFLFNMILLRQVMFYCKAIKAIGTALKFKKAHE